MAIIKKLFILMIAFMLFWGCKEPTPIDNSLPEHVYTGGKLGTTFDHTTMCYEQPTQAVSNLPTGDYDFVHGEPLFEGLFVTTPAQTEVRTDGVPMGGLGPIYIRRSCQHCHPGYGHGRRMEVYNTRELGNGYLLVVYDNQIEKKEPYGMKSYIMTTLTGMPQGHAIAPFTPSIDESKVDIQWIEHIDEYGNKYADGEPYSLIYPEVRIPTDAFYPPLSKKDGTPYAEGEYTVALEVTIGIYGTGLIDAIPDDSLRAQFEKEKATGYPNPATELPVKKDNDGNFRVKKYTYTPTRGALQDGAGANAMWNIFNLTRPTRRSLYVNAAWAKASAKEVEVQKWWKEKMVDDPDIIKMWQDMGEAFAKGIDSEEWSTMKKRLTKKDIIDKGAYSGNLTPLSKTANLEEQVFTYLMSDKHPIEIPQEQYTQFMVWHRGLAVPSMRDHDDPEVIRGQQLFYQMNCTSCHRPSWTTGEDIVSGDKTVNSRLPRYPHQKIWPYSDFMVHKMEMKNDVRTGWCRTTPLWGRGLSKKATGYGDHLHDARARSYEEAILWHGGEAKYAKDNFRKLPKNDRKALVRFLESI